MGLFGWRKKEPQIPPMRQTPLPPPGQRMSYVMPAPAPGTPDIATSILSGLDRSSKEFQARSRGEALPRREAGRARRSDPFLEFEEDSYLSSDDLEL